MSPQPFDWCSRHPLPSYPEVLPATMYRRPLRATSIKTTVSTENNSRLAFLSRASRDLKAVFQDARFLSEVRRLSKRCHKERMQIPNCKDSGDGHSLFPDTFMSIHEPSDLICSPTRVHCERNGSSMKC